MEQFPDGIRKELDENDFIIKIPRKMIAEWMKYGYNKWAMSVGHKIRINPSIKFAYSVLIDKIKEENILPYLLPIMNEFEQYISNHEPADVFLNENMERNALKEMNKEQQSCPTLSNRRKRLG